MLLRRIQSSDPVQRFRGEMDELFHNFFGEVPGVSALRHLGPRQFPAVNISEDESTVYAEIEIPGLKMEDVEVTVLGDQLAIKGRIADEERSNVNYHRRERVQGSFSRAITLPVEIDAEKVEAELRNGVLSITMPRAASVTPRKIEVKRADG